MTQPALHPDSTMAQVLEAYPGARRALFRKYHIGGCGSCAFQPTETLAQLASRNGGLDVQGIMSHIKTSHEQDQAMLVEPAELAQLLKSLTPPRLVDIRTREEADAAAIPGAILFTEEVMNDMLGRWNRADPVVIFDHTGAKCMDAAAYFLGHGFTSIRALRGGIDAWAAEVDPAVPRYHFE